ncbi:hypothetical protein NEDG_00515 [Nematocida displodere]|uniref:Uncharacterized protein n=1 Tax=Nematocida displodere TaxID=1805483 RepID=A0A177EKZ6_9MICR|nr:hypothetical protein NEDG_00515 [Nematocida displodere]
MEVQSPQFAKTVKIIVFGLSFIALICVGLWGAHKAGWSFVLTNPLITNVPTSRSNTPRVTPAPAPTSRSTELAPTPNANTGPESETPRKINLFGIDNLDKEKPNELTMLLIPKTIDALSKQIKPGVAFSTLTIVNIEFKLPTPLPTRQGNTTPNPPSVPFRHHITGPINRAVHNLTSPSTSLTNRVGHNLNNTPNNPELARDSGREAAEETSGVEIDNIHEVFTILSKTPINNLILKGFNLQHDIPLGTSKTSLSCVKRLHLIGVSPLFIRWLGSCVSVRNGTQNPNLRIAECPGITNLGCLDGLQFANVNFLSLRSMPKLRSLECQLLKEGRVKEGLVLWGLDALLIIDSELGKSIAKKPWKNITLDMHIWNQICQAGHAIVVEQKLSLLINNFTAPLTRTQLTPKHSTHTLEIIYPNGITITEVVFRGIIGWIRSSFDRVVAVKNNPEDLVTIEPKLKKYLDDNHIGVVKGTEEFTIGKYRCVVTLGYVPAP